MIYLITIFHVKYKPGRGTKDAFETIRSPEIVVNQLLCIITQRVNLFNVHSKVAIIFNIAAIPPKNSGRRDGVLCAVTPPIYCVIDVYAYILYFFILYQAPGCLRHIPTKTLDAALLLAEVGMDIEVERCGHV